MQAGIAVQVASGPQTLDMMSWMARVALEMVGQGALGMSLESLAGSTLGMTPYGTALQSLM